MSKLVEEFLLEGRKGEYAVSGVKVEGRPSETSHNVAIEFAVSKNGVKKRFRGRFGLRWDDAYIHPSGPDCTDLLDCSHVTCLDNDKRYYVIEDAKAQTRYNFLVRMIFKKVENQKDFRFTGAYFQKDLIERSFKECVTKMLNERPLQPEFEALFTQGLKENLREGNLDTKEGKAAAIVNWFGKELRLDNEFKERAINFVMMVLEWR